MGLVCSIRHFLPRLLSDYPLPSLHPNEASTARATGLSGLLS